MLDQTRSGTRGSWAWLAASRAPGALDDSGDDWVSVISMRTQSARSLPMASAIRAAVAWAARHQVRARARDLLSEGAVADEAVRRVLGLVLDAGEAVGKELFAAVAASDREAAESLSGWLVDAREVEQVEYAFREVAARIKEFALGRLILTKKEELRALDPKRDAEAYDRLFGEIAEAQRGQQELRAHGVGTTDHGTEHTA